jgi:transcriptional regulator with XRE-family HTH domain
MSNTLHTLTWTFGAAIERMRTHAGLDQEELGDRIGVSRSTISNWERERTVPHNFKTVQRLAEACDYDPNDATLRDAWDALIARYPVAA